MVPSVPLGVTQIGAVMMIFIAKHLGFYHQLERPALFHIAVLPS